MLQLKQRRGALELHAKHHFPTALETQRNIEAINAEQILPELKRAARAKGWRGKKACLAMDSKSCYLRMLALPPLRARELKQAVLWEARKHLPFNSEDAVISFMPLDKKGDRDNRVHRYLLAATLKERANFYTSLASKAGFHSVSLEAPATALLRSISARPLFAGTAASGCRLFVDCGYSSTLLLLTVNGRYCQHRLLHLGVNNFSRAVASGSSDNLKEALRTVYGGGVFSDEGLHKEAAKLIRSISESLAYWSGLNREQPFLTETIELSGGGMLIPGLATCLQQELGIKLHCYKLPCAPPGVRQGDEPGRPGSNHGALFSPACGLALRGWLR